MGWRRIALVPTMQLATFGKTPEEMRKGFVNAVLVPELLFSLGAEDRKLTDRPDIKLRIQDALRAKMMDALRKEVTDKGLTDEDVAKYYADNQAKFQTPERILIHRILVASKADALAILEELKKPNGDKKWRDLCRDKSLDKATHERSGNVGFIAADGQSNEPTVKVEPELFVAAKKVQNGEFVPEPVEVAGKWAVVWRRGSTPAVHRKLEDEAAPIRSILLRTRTEERVKETLERLRKEHVKDLKVESLGIVETQAMGPRDPGAKRVTSAEPRTPVGVEPKKAPEGLR